MRATTLSGSAGNHRRRLQTETATCDPAAGGQRSALWLEVLLVEVGSTAASTLPTAIVLPASSNLPVFVLTGPRRPTYTPPPCRQMNLQQLRPPRLLSVSAASASRAPSPSSCTARATCAPAWRSPSTSRPTTSPRATSAWRRPPSRPCKVQCPPTTTPHPSSSLSLMLFFCLRPVEGPPPPGGPRGPQKLLSVFTVER